MKKFFVLLFALVASHSFAQISEAIPGKVLVLIRAENADEIEQMFRPLTETPDFKDPQKLAIVDEAKIRELFVLPNEIQVTMLRPYIPQHSIANQNLRQHLNPILWYKVLGGQKIFETPQIAALRQAEGRVSRWFELHYTGNMSPEVLIATIRKSAIVEEAEPRYSRKLLFIPNDSLFSQQYAPMLMRAPEAWETVRADSSIIVADIDNGTDWTHPDLRNAIWVNYEEMGFDIDGNDKRANGIDDDGDGFVDDWHGWDFGGFDGNSPDNNPGPRTANHGTHTAGILAASGNNKTGVCGIAFGAKLIPIKASDDGGGSIDYGYDGMVYAADHGAIVANNSWGGTTRSNAEQDIINYATAKNCAIVAASGNNGHYEDFYPASYKNVLSVGANDPNGSVASFTNYGTHVDVTAPGTAVLSTIPVATYSQQTGTSMSSPNAAGALALVRKKFRYYEPAQAMERLRTTGDFVDIDATRKDLTGHGRVNILRAVSDSIFYSARIEGVDIHDGNDNVLISGESGDLVVNVRNYLGSVKDLRAKVEILSANEYVSFNTSSLDFGAANTLDLIQNLDAHFTANVAEIVPPNTVVLVKLTFTDGKVGYGPDVDYFSFVINPAYQDLNTNNLTVTFDSKGDIGYNDPPNNSQGNGFQWTKAPETISAKGKSVLWQAGLMMGINEERLVGAAPSEGNFSTQDFAIIKPIKYVTPDHPNAAQELTTIFDDSNAKNVIDSTTTNYHDVGITATQRSYSFIKGASADAVVVDYILKKRATISGIQPTDATSVALFMDWDIGLSGANNSAYLASDGQTAIMKRNDEGYPFVGIRLISALPKSSSLQYYAIENNGSNGSVSTYGGYDLSEKWITLTQDRHTAGPGDVSEVYGLRNVPMLSSDSVQLTYVMALGINEASLLQSIESAKQEWFNTTGVKPISYEEHQLTAYPNPFKDVLHLIWENTNGELSTITITDVIGRTLYQATTAENQIDIKNAHLPSGEYFIRVSNAHSSEGRVMVRE